jgi:hypothetical protein
MDYDPNQIIFEDIPEGERRAVLDLVGKLFIEARDDSIGHWDRLLAPTGPTGPRPHGHPQWERVKRRFPDMDERTREIVRDVLPHIIDTFLYNLLYGFDAHASEIQLAVKHNGKTFPNIARISWGLPGEPMSEEGWLVRFSKQRFEDPI